MTLSISDRALLLAKQIEAFQVELSAQTNEELRDTVILLNIAKDALDRVPYIVGTNQEYETDSQEAYDRLMKKLAFDKSISEDKRIQAIVLLAKNPASAAKVLHQLEGEEI